MTKKKEPDNWRDWGKYFGYPKCCIDVFCKGRNPENFDVAKNSGFVPCDKHAKKIRAGEIKLEDLILKGRKAPKFILPER